MQSMGKINDDCQEIINRIRVTIGTSAFRMAIGSSVRDSKTNMVGEGAIRDEAAGGLVLVCGRRL